MSELNISRSRFVIAKTDSITSPDSRAKRIRCQPVGPPSPFSQLRALRSLAPVHFMIVFAAPPAVPSSRRSAAPISTA